MLIVGSVAAFFLAQQNQELRKQACIPCPGDTCPDGWSYGPDNCAPQATCEQRKQEACQNHQGNNGGGNNTGNDCSNVTGIVTPQSNTEGGASQFILRCSGTFDFQIVTNETQGNAASAVCTAICNGINYKTGAPLGCAPSSAQCSENQPGYGMNCNEYGEWKGPYRMHACGTVATCNYTSYSYEIFTGCNDVACGNLGGTENCYRTCIAGEIVGSTTCRCEPNLSCGQPTQSFSCNSPCTTDAQCQTANSSYFCNLSDGSKCRLQNNPGAPDCQPPVATSPSPSVSPSPITGPMCISIRIINPLTNQTIVADPQVGDTVRFVCGQVAGTDHYIFRVVREEMGVITPLAATGNISAAFTVPTAGKYSAQCQICTGPTASTCHAFEQADVAYP